VRFIGRRQENFFHVCSSCRLGCCKGARPPITLNRRKVIEEYLRGNGIKIDNPFTETGYTFPREDAEGYCVFYKKQTKECLIQDVKPETCVAGPVTFDINVKTGKIEWCLKKDEVCPLAGLLFKNKESLRRHLQSARKEIFTLVRELEPEALRTVLRIEEPETFKIGEEGIEESVLKKC